MSATLTLNLPWVAETEDQLENLAVRRGRVEALSYDDGIVLDVAVLDPARFASADALIAAAKKTAEPGRVAVVAGAVPVEWRAQLRDAELSFIDVSGVAEISWPRLRVSARRFGQPTRRRRSALPFQKGHGLVAEELLIGSIEGAPTTIGELADRAGVSVPTASRAVSQLAEHGLVAKEREGQRVRVVVVDRTKLATLLVDRTAWPGDETLHAYQWGRTIFDAADRISAAAHERGIRLAVTGRVACSFLGVLGTSSPTEVRCWVDAGDRALDDIAEQLRLEPASGETSNVVLSLDRWRLGTHRSSDATLDAWSASVAHPVRVWCDIQSEQRGPEFAAQLWGMITHAR